MAVLLRTPEGGRGRWPLPGGSGGCAQQARGGTSRGSRRGRGRVWASQPSRWLWTRLPGCVMKAMHLVPALGSRSPGPSQDSLLWRSEWGLPGCGKKPVSCVHAGRPVGGRPREALGTSFQQSLPGRRCPWATRAPPLLGDSAPWVLPKAEQALMVMGAKGTGGVPAPGLREGPTWVLQPVCSRGHPEPTATAKSGVSLALGSPSLRVGPARRRGHPVPTSAGWAAAVPRASVRCADWLELRGAEGDGPLTCPRCAGHSPPCCRPRWLLRALGEDLGRSLGPQPPRQCGARPEWTQHGVGPRPALPARRPLGG